MVSWGDVTKIFNSNNVLFKMGTTPDSPDVTEEIILMNSFRMIKDVPVQRGSPRSGALDTPDFILREFLINADVTEDLYDKLEAVSDPTTRGGFQIEDFEMEANAISTVADDITLTCDGFVRHMEGISLPGGEKFNVDLIIRVLNNTVVIS